MQSTDIRWIIGGLFVAFLVIMFLKDLAGRKPKTPRRKAEEGFRRAPPPPQQPSRPQRTWKTPNR